MDSRLYWIWLQQAIGLGNPLSGTLLAEFSTVQEVYRAERSAFVRLDIKEPALTRLCDKSLDRAAIILKAALQQGGFVLTPSDAYYPTMLRGIYALPIVLYGRGSMPDLDLMPAVAVVGTRRMTPYGRETAFSLCAGLAAAGATVVSGGALGIDAAAAEGALYADGIVIDVQACGLDVEYPAPNEPLRRRILQRGALLSECPPGGKQIKPNFLVRNRLISGMTLGTCVVEAPLRSGALNTAHHAKEQGRDVFAVPGPVTVAASQGANHLIQEGAKLVYRAADILEEYESRFPEILDLEVAKEAEEASRYWLRAAKKPMPTVIPRETMPASRWRVADVQQPVPAKKSRPPYEEPSYKEPSKEPPVPRPKAVCPDSVSQEAKRIFAVLTDAPTPIDTLAQAVELPTSKVLAALTELEILGCVRSGAGQTYGRNE